MISAEDDRFFQHGGIDLLGIARALMVNTWHWEIRQGGSTLTQQFVKNYFLHSDRLLSRKLQELFLALLVERSLSKQEIFRLYANDVYLGQIGSFAIHGVRRRYTPPCLEQRTLTLYQADDMWAIFEFGGHERLHNAKSNLIRWLQGRAWFCHERKHDDDHEVVKPSLPV